MPYKDEQTRKEYNQAYGEANRGRIRAQKQAWREANREQYRERQSQYREANREAIREYHRMWRAEHPQNIYEHRKTRRTDGRFLLALCSARERAKKFGYSSCTATVEELSAAFDGQCQNPACRIPESECTRRLHLDHDHATGKFRGWLCTNCNIALGNTRDSLDVLQGLVSYLSKG